VIADRRQRRPGAERSDTLATAAAVASVAAAALLLFSAQTPGWLSAAAAGFLAVVFLARAVASGHIAGHTPADWPLLALLLLLPVGLWVSADLAITLPRTAALVAAAAVYWTVAAQQGRPWLRFTGWGLLLAGLIIALAVIAATQFPGGSFLSPLQDRIQLPGLRAGRFNPNLSGQLLALLLAPAAALALIDQRATRGSRLLRLAAAALSLLLAGLLWLTQSRGALLGVMVALPVMTTLANRRWLWVWVPSTVAVGLIAGAVLFSSPGSALVAGDGNVAMTAVGRVELWSRALFVMRDFPFTGVGLGMPEPVINLLWPLSNSMVGPDGRWLHVHNTALQIGSEMGIPGLIAFLALLLAVGVALARRASRQSPDWQRATAAGLLGSLIVFVVHGLVDAPLASPKLTVLFFGLLGLMAAMSNDPAQT
jgi:putative inorganic carbon (HCO3(-)) transporter